MKIKSITSRWILTTLAVIVIILLIVNIIFAISIQSYYYNYAEQSLASCATTNAHLMQTTSTNMSKNMNNEIRSLIENFSNAEKMVAMGLDFSGNVAATSDGFLVEGVNNLPDYNEALSSADLYSLYVGRLSNGEHVMTYTKIVTVTNNEFSAIRYMVSLEEIDSLIFRIILIIIIISLIALSFVIISGSFFVNSFVKPVREISTAIREIAAGDMSVRIKKHFNDEVGELCESINYMADELSNSEHLKNEFISSVSHELRTPLTAIQGWSETIVSVGPDDRETLHRGMRVIAKETERLSDMVEELLDFSRIQNGRFKLVKDKMDLFAELEEAVLIYTDFAMRDEKTLIYEEQDTIPTIFGDKNRIRQVFINVIDNALKYSDPGDTIIVKASVDDKTAKVIIEDNGLGIAKKDLPHVTEKFYKANNTRRGSGIGLAVVEEIIKMHDGKFTIDSIEGKGTLVTIELPLYFGLEEQTIEEFPKD
ncbi:MAG: HAMP domain-containing histidine kinase [Oscillospiraceae bacterium]|nr:HAMP domain-containing histidine kinase [Oscillospiraceae bacterium]